jgi:exodeoxyribonuclease V alpha subunit
VRQLGRAAKRMSEATGEEASTIHRLLEIGKIEENGFLVDINYQIAPIDADVIIIDEMSMVDIYIMNYILKGIYLGTKLILMGDSNQLPSVGPGNVLKDIIDSNKIPTIELNKIFRQAAKSRIITNAHKVNNGESFTEKNIEEKDKLDDFFYINESSQEKTLEILLSLCTGRLKEYGDYNFFSNIQVLSPTKKGMLGTKDLNKSLQEALNPNIKLEKVHGDRTFRVGDRVIAVKNNYDILWEKKENGKYEEGTGIFNGELGRVTNIDEELKVIEILFDDEKTVWYQFSDLDQIEHSYSITVHKSQRQ